MKSLRVAVVLALIVLLCGWQSRDSNYNKSVTAGGASYTGPGDVVSGATAWYGLRAYTAAIAAAATQKLINIRNIATSETCDVIVATNGGFGNVANCSGSSSGDTVAVFCAESSSSCAVTEAYDQTGNGINATQATAADQPALTLSCVGSLPCMTGTGSAHGWLSSSAMTSITQPDTISVVAKFTATNQTYVFTTNNGNQFLSHFTSANKYYCYAGATGLTPTVPDNVLNAVNWTVNNTSSVCNVNGTENSGTSGSAVTGTFITLMASSNAGAASMVGSFYDGGIWASSFTSTQRTNVCENQQAYWGAGNFGATC